MKYLVDDMGKKVIIEQPNLKYYSWLSNTKTICSMCYNYVTYQNF